LGFDRLHDFAFLAMQDYNLNHKSDWYGHFRNGERGLQARLFGVTKHYGELHSWKPSKRDAEEMDYPLASILFGMDSAMECYFYMLNALGWAAKPDWFADISNDKSLRAIKPANIWDMTTESPAAGYAAVFPAVQKLWQNNRWLIEFLIDQRDVSKHRHATIHGSALRSLDWYYGTQIFD